MAKQGTKTATPRLRFPEYTKAPPWRVKRFDQLLTIGSGKDYKHLSSGDIPVYGSGGYMLSVSDYLYEGESACIGRKGTIDRPIFLSGKFWAVDTLFYTHSFTDCLPRFVFFHFQNIDWKKHNEAGGVPSLSKTNIEKIEVAVPIIAEQQKIADCLTSLDEVIAAQGRKVEALKAHKRGLMQQLFPREGETSPRLRFPEFRTAREWAESTLGALTSIVRGGSPRPIDAFLTQEEVGLNWLKIGDVDREAKYITRTEEKVLPEALSKTRVINPGDFILSNSMSFGRPYISTIQTCIHDGWIAVTNIPRHLNYDFLYYAILSERSQAYFSDQAAGGGVQNLNTDIVKLLPLGLPLVPEQQMIAASLSALDAQIAAESHKGDDLKSHKLGLMQQLFPSIVED